MRPLRLIAALTAGLLASPLAHAADPRLVPKDGDVVVLDFAFADGERLPTLTLHYITLGTPVRDASGSITNAVLLLHGTTGSSAQFLEPAFSEALFGPGQPLDIQHLYIVIPDGLGAGRSSKPSDGLGGHFPHYGYNDQVRAQHDLLGRIGVTHVKLVLGTSMGGMQTWLWGETYPNDMDALVAIASTPAAITGRNMLWRAMILEAIRADPQWKGGDYPPDAKPSAWRHVAVPLFTLMTGNPETLQALAPTRAAAAPALDTMADKAATTWDAADIFYKFDSSADYDPAPKLGAISKPMLAINFADDLLNPPEFLDLPNTENLDHVMLPGGSASFGHQTLNHSAAWVAPLKTFLNKIPGWRG